jgi:hypothetical protein
MVGRSVGTCVWSRSPYGASTVLSVLSVLYSCTMFVFVLDQETNHRDGKAGSRSPNAGKQRQRKDVGQARPG